MSIRSMSSGSIEGQRAVDPTQIENRCDAADLMILRNGVFKVERVEQLLLPTLQSPHHRPLSVAHALSSNGITVREYAQHRLLQHYRP
jgi:hypothetical protein